MDDILEVKSLMSKQGHYRSTPDNNKEKTASIELWVNVDSMLPVGQEKVRRIHGTDSLSLLDVSVDAFA